LSETLNLADDESNNTGVSKPKTNQHLAGKIKFQRSFKVGNSFSTPPSSTRSGESILFL